MARMFPASLEQVSGATVGEKKMFNLLRAFLPDEYIVFYNQPINGHYPDFIVVGPTLGVVILEVKDWESQSIISMNNETANLRTIGSEHKNPLKQAHDYMMSDLLSFLSKHPELLQTDGKYVGRPKFNYGYGVVLTTISQADWETKSWHEAIPVTQCLFKSDLLQIEKGAADHLAKKISGMIPADHRFTNLSSDDMKFIAKTISKVDFEPIPEPQSIKGNPIESSNSTMTNPPQHTQITEPRKPNTVLVTAVLVVLALVGIKWLIKSDAQPQATTSSPTPVIVIQQPAQNTPPANPPAIQQPVKKIIQQAPESPREAVIKGHANDAGEKIYHLPGSGWYDLTKNGITWFRTEEEAKQAGFRAAKPTIKGNTSYTSGEKIYHMPGQAYYDAVKRPVWFNTEADAIAAGYRKSYK